MRGNSCISHGRGRAINGKVRRTGAARGVRRDLGPCSARSRADGFVSGARQQSQQLAAALDEATQDAGDRKRPVAMRHGHQDLTRQLLGQEHGALGLATWAKFPLSATEGDKVFSVALWTTDTGEAWARIPHSRNERSFRSTNRGTRRSRRRCLSRKVSRCRDTTP